MPQNFQNWQSMGMDAAPQAPSSPSGIPGTEFQDWSNLVGPSDIIKKTMMSAATGGVAPPQQSIPATFDDVMKQAIAPVTNKFNSITNRFDQAAQGNIFNAVTGQNPAAKPQPVGEQHDHEW